MYLVRFGTYAVADSVARTSLDYSFAQRTGGNAFVSRSADSF